MKNQEITSNCVIRQAKGNIVSDMDGEKVMLSIQNGKYYNLGTVGGDIWDILEESMSIHQLISKLVALYDVKETECEQQIRPFLEHLLKEELIQLNEKEA